MQEIVVAQKEGYWQILENTKEIHNTITNLNQQNREYYSLRFGEVQKELSGMKVELQEQYPGSGECYCCRIGIRSGRNHPEVHR